MANPVEGDIEVRMLSPFDGLLTRRRMLRRLGISESVFRRLRARPDFPKRYNVAASWGGRLWRFRESEVQRFVDVLVTESCVSPAAPSPEESERGRAMRARRTTAARTSAALPNPSGPGSTEPDPEQTTTTPASHSPTPGARHSEPRRLMGRF